MLGHGNRLYHSLLQRNFPTNRYFPQPPTTDYINEFFDYLLRVMTRYDVSMHQKEYVVEFLSACFQEDRLSEYFFMNLHRFRDPIVQLWKEVNADLSPGLMIRLLLMLNLMLVKDPSTPTIKFVRACIPDPEKTGSEIIGLCRATMSKMDLASRHQNTYLNLLWCSKAKEIAICESNLLLYLGVISYLVSHDLESSVESITEIIFKEADMFLRKVAEIPSTFDFDELKLTTTRIYPRSKMVGKIDFMPFQEEILRSLFLHSPCSIIENIFYQPWEIYQKARSHKS